MVVGEEAALYDVSAAGEAANELRGVRRRSAQQCSIDCMRAVRVG